MTKLVSQQIDGIQQDIMQVVENGPLPQELNFKLGAVYAKLEMVKRTAHEQESAYESLIQIQMARNPSRIKSLLQTVSDIITGDNLCE